MMSEIDEIKYLKWYIEKQLPNGCANMESCDGCPLDKHEPNTIEEAICDMLELLANRAKKEEL